MIEISKEKQEIIDCDSNTLVLANPGTGKTFTLAHKYLTLVKNGVSPSDILCLTFTRKARLEMETRILELLSKSGEDVNLADMNIHTFHSFALDNLIEDDLASSNLLRYTIYKYLREKDVLNYSETHLIETIIPKIENLIRKIKSFGILPHNIDYSKVITHLDTAKKPVSMEELKVFAKHFISIFKKYEDTKQGRGIDYSDMLIQFRDLENKPKFKYVLVDELQDVSKIEAQIALACGEKYFVVGDKKQSIFGFQGGSISNFDMFLDAKKFVLSENRRSTNEILRFCSKFFISKTKDKAHLEDLRDFSNPQDIRGEKPTVYKDFGEDACAAGADIALKLSEEYKSVAIIVRSNWQILKVSEQLNARGARHTTTFSYGSKSAKAQAISYLNGLISSRIEDIVNSMFTPYFPIRLQYAFELTRNENISLEDIYRFSPAFEKIRQKISNVEDLRDVFRNRIVPTSIAYGREHTLAALSVGNSFNEALEYIEDLSYSNVLAYVRSSDMQSPDPAVEEKIVVTTVHKAKGREYDAVVYLPNVPKDTTNFADLVERAILLSEGIDASEEIEEEGLRIDFVALTRACKSLHILSKDPREYINEFCQTKNISSNVEVMSSESRGALAYNLAINGDLEGAKASLEEDKTWVCEFVKKHFESMKTISFSSLTYDPLEYLSSRILGLYRHSEEMELGTQVHKFAQNTLEGKDVEARDEYCKNVLRAIERIKMKYGKVVGTEVSLRVELEKLCDFGSDLLFVGKIDAVFSDERGNILIVDWKTSKSRESSYKQQLEAYKKAYSIEFGVALSKISTAIAYVGLRDTVNLGNVTWDLDDKEAAKTAFGTFARKVHTLLEWRDDLDKFVAGLRKKDSALAKAVVGAW